MLRLALVWILCFSLLPASPIPRVNASEMEDLRESTYAILDGVAEGKKRQLTSYLSRMLELAVTAREDPVLQWYFGAKKRSLELQQEHPNSPEALKAVETLQGFLLDYYLQHYLAFYNILFVDNSGYVLSSVRRQDDYHRNLFGHGSPQTALARHLQDKPSESFVDYEFYGASGEPSAFFVEPLFADDQQLGWLVLQCAVNRINTIFTRGERLGETGEVFLVNRQQQILTDSRLDIAAGQLARPISRENIESKFAEKQGHKRVTDYRGYTAMTAFSTCPVMGSEWLLIAKIDEDEVVTGHYLENQSRLQPILLQALKGSPQPECAPRTLPTTVSMVDMDEFQASSDTPLITFGVGTCTAIVVSLPRVKAYLGHASIQDRIYGAGDLDLLDYMLRRIRQFEIYPYQIRSLEVVLVARHLESVAGAVDKLVETGFLLSQIRFLHCPEAISATVFHLPTDGQTVVRWAMGKGMEHRWQCAADLPSLGDTVKESLDVVSP
jgi:hypothetical protein